MGEIEREIEMRIAGASRPGCAEAVEQAIRAIDADARVRVDPATGIVHAMTRRETLEVTEAVTRAGFEATAMTG